MLSAVPYAADLIALRTVPPRVFGTFMSVHPVPAALTGLALLGQGAAPARVGRDRRGDRGAGREQPQAP
ncbi:hypothetical protein COUCH_04705 [Couchioplanes caeruleus]|uniref:hypothetical protein n=1 Tax=Couchioplanes caeruleus TaxID=56438 RepID=UPI0020BE529B|nr:hypothetical protein [Couchioplanes caeruleus]UQU65629.1 hypothetical protein COUCH_04705 [Couchioplanes caeruleus]